MNIEAPRTDAAVIDLHPRKTREDVESLKRGWVKDPCWEIEGTEGFEAHVDELTVFANAKRREWDLSWERLQRENRDARMARAAAFGCSLSLLDYIEGLEARVKRFEDQEREAGERAYWAEEVEDMKRRRAW